MITFSTTLWACSFPAWFLVSSTKLHEMSKACHLATEAHPLRSDLCLAWPPPLFVRPWICSHQTHQCPPRKITRTACSSLGWGARCLLDQFSSGRDLHSAPHWLRLPHWFVRVCCLIDTYLWIFHFFSCYWFLVLFHCCQRRCFVWFHSFKFIETCLCPNIWSMLENVLCNLNVYSAAVEYIVIYMHVR